MKKLLLTGLFIFIETLGFSQTGIGTTDPKATLDIAALNPTGSSTNVDGIIIPRVDRQRAQSMTSVETSTIIYVNDETTGTALGIASNINQKGFYYFDGTKWVRFTMSTSSILDIGYIVGWSASTNPPDYLLPISGGTFNWADYPDLQAMNNTHPIQFIQSSTATSFTLKDINNSGKFLRGNSVSGIEQSQGTALPTISFATNSMGDHSHTVDPASVNTTSNGSHQHDFNMVSKDDGNFSNVAGQYPTGDANKFNGTNHYIQTEATGTHTHSVDIPLTTSSTTGNHSHTIISGGDTETRPTNISVVWCLKAKSTNSSGNITINNGNITSLTNVGTSGVATLTGSTLNIPQYNSANYGDVKTGFQTSDHNGWIKLDGRLKTLLTATQKAQADIFITGSNLPNANNAYLVQNGGTLGAVIGSNTTVIAQNQLPNVGIGIPDHSHTGYDYYISSFESVNGFDTTESAGIPYNNSWSWRIKNNEAGGEGLKFYGTERSYGTSSASLSTYSINGNVGQVALDKKPMSMCVNTFIYLGN